MVKINLFDLFNPTVKQIEINDNFLSKTIYQQAMFDQIIAENAGKRQGTHSTLTKSEVAGGGKKPFAQKHTGRARQGSIRNPHWVGGGVCFGPKPNRNYKLKLNAKIAKIALKSALTIKFNANAVCALDDGFIAKEKNLHTKDFAKFLEAKKMINKRVLFVFDFTNNLIVKKVKNIEKVVGKNWNQISTQDLLKANFIVFQNQALKKIMERIG